jgi:cytochrome c oxidase subunit 2
MYPEDALTGLNDSFAYAGEVDRIFLFIVGISVLLLALITVLMIYFVIRYRRNRHPEAVDIEGNTLLEIIWTLVPTALVIAMFYYGWIGFKAMRDVPDNAMNVGVTGQMWFWKFEYKNGRQTDSLHVPVGVPVKLNIESLDVIHSLYIPAFRIKEDAVPGAETYLWFVAENEGDFDIFCAEYCGTGHSSMNSKVIAHSEEEFRRWYNAWEPEGTGTAAGPDSTSGAPEAGAAPDSAGGDGGGPDSTGEAEGGVR